MRFSGRSGLPLWRTRSTATVEVCRSGRWKAVDGRRLVHKIADPKMPFGGTWTDQLGEPSDDSTFTIPERSEVYNPFFRTVTRGTDMGSTIDTYWRALGKKLAEVVAPPWMDPPSGSPTRRL